MYIETNYIKKIQKLNFQKLKNRLWSFFVLSIKHKMTNSIDPETGNAVGIMKIIDFNIYDLKLISDKDISYNPALGSGQLQIRNIHKVSSEQRDTVEFIKMLDRKFISCCFKCNLPHTLLIF